MTAPVPDHRPSRITLADGAKRLGVHRETLRRWARRGLITYWTVGAGQYMTFDPKDIEAFEQAGRHERHAPPVE